MTKFTQEQTAAIQAQDLDVVVTASAGSGKTTVLVERIKENILSGQLDLEKLLAITFTKDAASNLKSKIYDALLKNNLESQLAKVSTAHIMTIDALCLDIAKKYYYKIPNLDEETLNNQIDTIQEEKLKNKIFDTLLEDGEYNEVVLKYSKRKLKELIFSLYTKVFSNVIDPKVFLGNSYADLNKSLENNFEEKITDYFKELVGDLRDIIEFISSKEKLTPAQKSTIERAEDLIDKLNNADLPKEYITLSEIFGEAKINGSTVRGYKEVIARYTRNKDAVLSLVENIELSRKYNDKSREVILELALQFFNEYKNAKLNSKLVDYSDVQAYALKILDFEDVKAEYKDRYQEIYVDEFQDTNAIQDALVAKLRGDDTKLFIVGDIKQSIYRFRQADPSIMEEYVEKSKSNTGVTRLNLPHNFRSTKDIIEFNNNVYKTMMAHKFSEEDVAKHNPEKEEKSNIETTVFYKRKDEKPQATLKDIAEYITNDIGSKGYKFKDVTVLTSSNANVTKLKKCLSDLGVPVYANSKTSFFENEAVHTVLNFLKIIENSKDKEAWLYLLQSSIFELSYREIAKLKEDNKFSLENYLKNSKVKKVFETLLKDELVDNVLETKNIHFLLNSLSSRPIVEIITYILTINNFYKERVSKTERAGLDRLVEIAASSNYSIRTFLEYLKDFETLELEDASALSEEDNVVKIMTIHKSKGLEFKNLYLHLTPGKSQEKESMYSYNKQNGISIADINDNQIITDFVHNANIEINKQLEFEETTRLLYVATTRAEKNLSILLDYSSAGHTDEESVIGKITEEIYLVDRVELETKTRNQVAWMLKSTEGRPLGLKKIKTFEKENETYEEEFVSLEVNEVTPAKINLDLTFASGTESSEEQEGTLYRKAADRGTRIHKAIEKYHLYTDKLDSFVDKKDADRIRNLYANEEFKNYLAHTHEFETMYYTSEDATEREVRNNIIDFWAELDDKVVIVDFKTNHYTEEADYIKTYKEQLDRYRDYIQKQNPTKKVETYIYSLELEKMIEV